MCSSSLSLSLASPAIESDDEDFEPPLAYRQGLTSRRKSVYGESYEPDTEEADVEKVNEVITMHTHTIV